MNKTRVERAVEKAVEQAVEQTETKARRAGQIELLEAQIADRFGPLSEESLTKLRALPNESLRQLGVGILKASSLADLGL